MSKFRLNFAQKMYNPKQIGSLLLIVLLSLKVLVAPIIYLDYEVRKDYIKNYLCENRNRPELHCDGKCYLAKRLAAADQKEQTEKGQELNRMLFGAEFMHEKFFFDFPFIETVSKFSPIYSYQELPPQESISSIFHPPSLF